MNLRRVYETTVIVNAALEDDDVEAVISKVTGYIENNGGKIEEINRWGRRRLAYPINKKYNGYYVHIVFEANPNILPILERFLVLEDTILRHLSLVLPKKLRDYRNQRAMELGNPYGIVTVDEKRKPRESKEAEKKSAPAVKVNTEKEVENNSENSEETKGE